MIVGDLLDQHVLVFLFYREVEAGTDVKCFIKDVGREIENILPPLILF